MILMNCRLDAFEGAGHVVAGLDFDRHLAGFVADDDMVFIECRGVLADGGQFLAQRPKRRSVDGILVAHRHNTRVGLVPRGLQHKTAADDAIPAFTSTETRWVGDTSAMT